MQTIDHKGYKIEALSYPSDEGKWIPYAKVTPIKGSASQNVEEAPLTWEREFGTQIEADDFALQGAQLYIDSNF